MIPVFNPLGHRTTIISQLHISMVDCNKGLNFSIGLGGGRIHQPQKFSKISAQNWTDRGGSILVPRAVIFLAPRFEPSIVLANRIVALWIRMD